MAKLSTDAAWEFADAIKQVLTPKYSKRRATVQSVDKDGTIWVQLPGSNMVTPVQTTGANVSPGDVVTTELRGTNLCITENRTDPAIGESKGRSITREIVRPVSQVANSAKTIADEANKVATATGQHFWDDDNGAHVTEVTRNEWEAAVAGDFSDYNATTKPYHNLLMNSLGILLRTALKNLVSITQSAIAFFDGNGNASSNIVASFGVDGAQIGKNNSSHIELGPDSLSIVNEDGATMFDVDMDAGSLYTMVTAPSNEMYGNTQTVGTGTYVIESTETSESFDVGSGSTLTIKAAEELFSVVLASQICDQSITIPLNGMTVNGLSYGKLFMSMVFYNTSQITFTYGTAATVARSASGSFDSTITGYGRYKYSFSLDLQIRYGGSTTYDVYSKITLTIDSLGDNASERVWVRPRTVIPRTYYLMLTSGAALTFGTRQDGSTNGLLSSSFGEGLIASSEKQAVFGKYNEEDSNDDYALIIGNGTADNARSNAYAQKWDGTHVFANGTKIWDNSSGNTHLLTPEVGTKQAEYSFEGGGLYVRKRTRTSTSAAWGSWSSWTLIA